MRLTCQKALVLALAVTLGCHDSTAPLILPAQFELANVSGRPLPTYFLSVPGFTVTVLSASLTLDDAGKAVMTEHLREYNGIEATTTSTFDYKIKDNRIEIGGFQPCPINANCIGIRVGTISGETLSLIMQEADNGPVVYNYRIVPAS